MAIKRRQIRARSLVGDEPLPKRASPLVIALLQRMGRNHTNAAENLANGRALNILSINTGIPLPIVKRALMSMLRRKI